MADSDRTRWEERYAAGHGGSAEPATVLTEYTHLLPEQGRALDLACGHGANALFLARRGLDTSAWDSSETAIALLVEKAYAAGLRVAAECRDVIAGPPPPRSFDVIVVSRFLDRGLAPAIAAALRPRGLLYYQTFLREAAAPDGPRNPDYRLGPNELLRLFAPLRVLAYHEEGLVGDLGRGRRNEAMLVAQKPGAD